MGAAFPDNLVAVWVPQQGQVERTSHWWFPATRRLPAGCADKAHSAMVVRLFPGKVALWGSCLEFTNHQEQVRDALDYDQPTTTVMKACNFLRSF